MSKTLADAIFEAELHTKKDPKVAALQGMTGDDLRLVEEALNIYRVFGIKKYDAPKTYAPSDSGYAPFFKLLDNLASRALTGNAAKVAVADTLSQYTERTAKALARVLDKDLKCGATISTFKKVYPSLNIPEFDLMGAESMNLDPAKGKVYEWRFPCIGESKYDGQRAIIMCKKSGTGVELSYWSRNGKPLDHLAGLFDSEFATLHGAIGRDFIMDGEALARSFAESISARGSDNADAKDALNFYCFDWMYLDEWNAQHCPRLQAERSSSLKTMLDALKAAMPASKLIKSKFRILNNLAEAHEFYAEVLAEGVDDDGKVNGQGEGLIIKYMDAPYLWNLGGSRGPEWTKWKPVIDVDGEIVGFELGDPGTKNADKLGRLHVVGVDENGRKFASKVGGIKVSHKKFKPLLDMIAAKLNVQFDKPKAPGYVKNKDQLVRTYIWENQAEFIGKFIMIEAQELTLAEDATVWSLRFPQMCELRTDK